MNYKSIIFFAIFFGMIIYFYFHYETFVYYFPIPNLIKFGIVLIGISGFFFPHVIKMLKDGEDYENIKTFIIEKYKKK
jgi:hypothetical protein